MGGQGVYGTSWVPTQSQQIGQQMRPKKQAQQFRSNSLTNRKETEQIAA